MLLFPRIETPLRCESAAVAKQVQRTASQRVDEPSRDLVDLTRQRSGLDQAVQVLEGVRGISFTWFSSKDVVRHPLVKRILDAYETFEGNGES